MRLRVSTLLRPESRTCLNVASVLMRLKSDLYFAGGMGACLMLRSGKPNLMESLIGPGGQNLVLLKGGKKEWGKELLTVHMLYGYTQSSLPVPLKYS